MWVSLMAKKLKSLDKLSTAITEELKLYSSSVVEGMKKVNDECMEEFVSDTKRDAPISTMRRKGTFRKNITSKTLLDTPNKKVNVWYVKNPEYRLTHLLKNGHATRTGKRTKAQDFITPNYEKLEKNFEEGIKEVIERGY